MMGFTKYINELAETNESLAALVSIWPFAVLVLVAGIVVMSLVKSRKSMKAGRQAAMAGDGPSDLGQQLATIDLENYNFDGPSSAAKPAAPNVNLDDFFSNSERRSEIGGSAPSPAPAPAAAPKPAPATSFPVPTLAELPARRPGEPEVSRDAVDRLMAVAKAADENRKTDPAYKPTQRERIAMLGLDAYAMCSDSFVYILLKKPNIKRHERLADIAMRAGAPDLAEVITLQTQLLEMTSGPDWQSSDRDDERWHDVKTTADALIDLFRAANESNAGLGRYSTLVDAMLHRRG